MRRLVLAATLLAGSASGQAQDAASGVQFVTPRRFQTVVGVAQVELKVVPPAGATVASVTLKADGSVAGSKSVAPWVFTWDSGDGTRGHELEAIATFSDGTSARAKVATSRLVINETEEVALVNVYAIARDTSGKYVTDLQPNDMRIFENTIPQALERFSAERKPLRIAIVLDTSLSMKGDSLKAAIASAVEFLSVVQSGDEGLVVGFSDDVRILQDLTSNRTEMETAIRGVEAKGGTALYDAIVKASERLAAFDGRRVMVVLSDGRDEAANGLEPGSLHTLEEAQERALRNEVMVFAIGLGRSLARDAKDLEANPTARAEEMDFYGRKPLVTILKNLSETTGGTSLFSPGAGQLRRSFERIADDLRHQYSLAYTSDDPRHDGSWRAIKVTVVRPGVSVTNRKGYYAPSDAPVPRKSTKLRP